MWCYIQFIFTLLVVVPGLSLGKPQARIEGDIVTIENSTLKRTITTKGGVSTTSILNKLDGKTLAPESAREFILHLKDGSMLSPSDFSIVSRTSDNPVVDGKEVARVEIVMKSARSAVEAKLIYLLGSDDSFSRKSLELTPAADLELTRIDLESLQLAQAYQPYTISQITARGPGKWRPGLGQPLYTRESGTFWGIEHPASINTAKVGDLTCSYLVGKTLKAGQRYTTCSSVLGVADSPDFVKEAFFDYIDQTRIRPLRLQVQYNCWFDQGKNVEAAPFIASIRKIHDELNVARGVPPLSAYVIDDGWQDTSDWSDSVWKVNKKFDPEFKDVKAATKAAGSSLGLWLSPGCVFGGQPAIPAMRKAGFRALDPWMSLSDPRYMDKLTDRLGQLTRMGVTYFKLDGVFGHLNTRNFDIEGFKGSEEKLNDSQYDLQKIQYLTEGSDRLIDAFQKMHAINPNVYIVISNGAWLSPWWLQHVDSVWMINAGDAAKGAGRTGELVYRDRVYHDLAVSENTQFPLCSIFNHEPKKTTSEETKDAFRKYLYMHLSRGTGFVELYIKPDILKAYDWDVLAEGLLWARQVFPTFKHSKMHGGDPGRKEVYGYTAWQDEQGYVSLHNPADKPQTYAFTLDRKFGLTKNSAQTTYQLSSPLADSLKGLKNAYRYGDTITVTLQPSEIRILNFETKRADWSKLTALQNRTPDDFKGPR
ncbi:hypothetical protein KBB96_01955 [Luteolibacter ambystomatis]|uniref:Uncharacterized protein n=1 Tax=Luteolibacter ambystomatis TaxID=2824561 RepID=A0A975J0B4_9BACT|nr:hypothetical protein [Luteolibacter ambystomatis]QUE51667.1 hypothetical protein KBB96_01955 [Luteolibacter ambystomatis]